MLEFIRVSVIPTDFPPDCAVEVVFDRIVCAAWQEFCYVCPLIAMCLLVFEDDLLFFFGPIVLGDYWVKVIMPALTALFGCTASDVVTSY